MLLDNGASAGTVSFEMELPLDVAQGGDMLAMLREAMQKQGIDPLVARQAEQQCMLDDAKEWLRTGKYP